MEWHLSNIQPWVHQSSVTQGLQTQQYSVGCRSNGTKIDATLPGPIFNKVHFLAFLHKTIKTVYFYAKRLKNFF